MLGKIAVSCGYNCYVVDSMWYTMFCGKDKSYSEKVVRWMLRDDRFEQRYVFFQFVNRKLKF